ncbi:High-affinity branched-chain amino acid transport ATP-binding protein LivF [Sporotomaculum syntrophicum]|uniref:High-affinity branched-chain amino acid transport ATP-binding protein LivF n=1 Tax=Sporotomaculum syntrophicum TaxID=182264 RepID=A0A9D2WPG1_9FIRM|nr:ABC transporter ATP-binding protein [Sporotomaculum syntrophicum]KAF1084678.1 High-affinity branched-chain amino acid transport ATP-binding protein LivF [Sporotomaculum syntrophicum]
MLCVENLHYSYGTINALSGISFQVNEGEIVALIGANGAGKSTTLLNISGLLHPQSGLIKYQGVDISKLPPHKVVEAGISLVPEGRRVFSRMTVLENLVMGAYLKKSRVEIKESIERVFDRFTRLKERRNQLAGTLSGGEQQMLAIGRALMSKPKLLLMDEPSMGLAPMLVQEIFSIAKEINQSGTTILLVEQNAYMALSIAQHAYVLETGAIVLQGTAEEIANNPEVKKAYLGE